MILGQGCALHIDESVRMVPVCIIYVNYAINNVFMWNDIEKSRY